MGLVLGYPKTENVNFSVGLEIISLVKRWGVFYYWTQAAFMYKLNSIIMYNTDCCY